MRNLRMSLAGIGAAAILAVSTGPLPAEEIPVDQAGVRPGTTVSVKGEEVLLYDGSLAEGESLLEVMAETDIDFPFRGRVTIVSFVPSLDTPVCEVQTYRLRTMAGIDPQVDIITVSRDLPMAQARFAADHDMTGEGFVSDYKTGSFGKATGLMMQGKELLARGVLVLDEGGVIRHLQVVPEVTHLPDLDKAVAVANALAGGES